MGHLSRVSHGLVSLGDGRGGQGALGEQLHLVIEALQPHRLVRAGIGGEGGSALDSPTPSSLGSSKRYDPHTPHRQGNELGIWGIPGSLKWLHHSPELRYKPS